MDTPFRFEFVAAPEDLAGYVNTLFVFRTDLEQLDDILPAYSAQMMAFGLGSARMQLGKGQFAESDSAFFLSPMQSAAAFSMTGPVRACGVSLTALGWAALSQLPVDTYGHRKIAASAILGQEDAAAMAETGMAFAAERLEAASACERLADIVRRNITPVRLNHAAFIDAAMAWLSSSFSPDLADLAEETGLSERQIQRLCKRYFGKPPTTLVRRYRAIRAATLLSQPNLEPSATEEITGAFFDQSHMIRDIRHYTGRTPKSLRDTGPSVTTDTLGPEGYGVVDLFGSGSEAAE